MVYAWGLQLCLLDTDSNPTWLPNEQRRPPGSRHSTSSTLFFRSFVFALSYSRLLFMCWSSSSQIQFCSEFVMRWPTVPCLCFRGPTTYRLPNLEGEQIGRQTTALRQSLWRLRWAQGRFVTALRSSAHLENFFSLTQSSRESTSIKKAIGFHAS